MKYLNVFDLDARIVEMSSEFFVVLEEFKNLNPELKYNKLLDFNDLFIVEFTRNPHD